MKQFSERLSAIKRVPRRAALIAVAAVIVLGTGGIAVANNTGKSHSRSAAKRRALVARKRREGRSIRVHALDATAGYTYPEQGVNVQAAPSNAADEADQSGMATPTAAITALTQNRAAESVFGAALTSGSATAELATVTEQYPIAPGIGAGTPYTAWVVKTQGPGATMGGYNDGSGSQPAPTVTTCNDVGIYSLSLQEWTELLRTCQ
jgi:hypothetical protein